MKRTIKNEEAQAGVGTLIIFIAMVLVAAVAAAVLIQTSGVMQSKSTSTTKEAAAAIGENIVIEAVDGDADPTGNNLVKTFVTIRLAPGGSDVDLSKVTLKVKNTNYKYGTGDGYFGVTAIRDVDSGLAGTPPMLKPGALGLLTINKLVTPDYSAADTGFTSRQSMPIALTPEKGTTFNLPITLPAIAAGKIGIALYP